VCFSMSLAVAKLPACKNKVLVHFMMMVFLFVCLFVCFSTVDLQDFKALGNSV